MDNKLAPTLSSIFTLIYKQTKKTHIGWNNPHRSLRTKKKLYPINFHATTTWIPCYIFITYKYGIVSLFIQICSYWFYTVNFLDKRRSKAILQESDFTITLTNTSPSSTDNDDDQLDQTSEHQNIHAMVLTGFFFLFSLSFFSIHWFTPVR